MGKICSFFFSTNIHNPFNQLHEEINYRRVLRPARNDTFLRIRQKQDTLGYLPC
jgi:hypothetical protein